MKIECPLALVVPYFDDEPAIDSDAGAYFEAMVTLIEAYEAKHYPMSPPNPILALLFRMGQQELKPRDLRAHDWGGKQGVRGA